MVKTDEQLDRGLLDGLVGYHLRRAQLAVFRDFADSVGALGVTPGQFGVLELIACNPGLSQSALARALGVDRSTLVAVLDRLQGDGLIERRPSPTDRRSHELVLTRAGTKRVDEARAAIRAHETRVLSGLSETEVAALIRALSTIA
ncbi:MAG: MarR family winged helix-turn-helix transcriptional regulator [Minwuia sp.]|uniref:MarR family winged helix-turn-helix transcriptional regulator n=1 Tax=Minwuia sp. TaxID=2493630 RepID=UPI003A891537